MKQDGRIIDQDWSRYDFRHVVFQPMLMSREELQAGADWLYARFYRLDRIVYRFLGNLARLRWTTALLGLKLGLTYRYDNRREQIVGWNPSIGSLHSTGNGCTASGLAAGTRGPVLSEAGGADRFVS